MLPRYYLHTRHQNPEGVVSHGMRTIDTAMSKEEILAQVKALVEKHIEDRTLFVLPGSMGMHNPYRFVDSRGRFMDPTIETEEEYEARMQQGLPVPSH